MTAREAGWVLFARYPVQALQEANIEIDVVTGDWNLCVWKVPVQKLAEEPDGYARGNRMFLVLNEINAVYEHRFGFRSNSRFAHGKFNGL